MPTKIRLARHGRKGRPFYYIVVADSRAPRDGRFIEKIGTYNPNTDPAAIDLKFERALYWVQEGAQPTDTCRAILSYEGVLMKKHLLGGVKKGAFDEEAADKKFDEWLTDKRNKVQAKKDKLAKEADAESQKRLSAETEVMQKRADSVAKKQAEEAAVKAEEAGETAAEEEVAASEEAPAKAEEAVKAVEEEAKVEETPPAEVKEEVAETKGEETPAEVKEEASTEEKKEEKKAEDTTPEA